MSIYDIIAELTSMVISIAGFLAFVLIINIILKAHYNDDDYDKKRTVRFFMYLFFVIAIVDTLLILERFYSIGRSFLTVLFVVRSILTVITVIYYYMDIPKFTDKKISLDKHYQSLKNVILEFENSDLSPEVKKKFISKLENYVKR